MRFIHLIIACSLCMPFAPLYGGERAEAAAMISEPATKQTSKGSSLTRERMELFQWMEALYGVPWHYLAAIDQYERTINKKRKSAPVTDRLTAITIPPAVWSGYLNPEEDDTDESSISFFGGIGIDGSGDGQADQQNDIDVLTAMIRFLSDFGYAREDFRIGVWMYYRRDRAVKTIDQFAAVYEKYQTLQLDQHAFPIPRRYTYSYRSTWGDPRGWGGRRIHEGTDIFADYGTPVLATGYGVVEVVGWNRYGGWRVGIRDMNNIYHYFAHLSSFRKGLKAGDIVEPGQVIGYVGSSGYGKPGTSGKFPPHLHYGMYRDTGSGEWSFDPYPQLRSWEREMRRKKK
ncbi:M23 family metallopeptidase [Brevibacillus humidisoli]|uniref:M23 family metallopeptidase n=1 Tax=Brevibacillus humidisoli TaxID=2895522 RepID=UPI001E61C898|nr:M23 family metallopeptidase [Brevibacillus humidisoli]UFJ39694.1 M23 family metallopeptidase [Brevibacillus humidisoli]